MKIDLTKYLKKLSQSYTLSHGEKEKMERVLVEYMAMKPVTSDASHRPQLQGFSLSMFSLTRQSMPFAAVALLLTASVSFAAEGALPGDLLYPVKVSVNEEVRGALAFTTEAQAEWDARRAERRLEEATTLIQEGKLTADADSELAIRFEEHAANAVATVQALETEDAPSAIALASSFETRLAAHEVVIGETDASSGKTPSMESAMTMQVQSDARVSKEKESPRKIKQAIRDKASRVARIRENAEGTVAVSSGGAASASMQKKVSDESSDAEKAAGRMKSLAKIKVRNASDLFARLSSRIEEDAKAKAKAEIEAAQKLLKDGDAFHADGDFSASFHAYQEALVLAEKLTVHLKSNSTKYIQETRERDEDEDDREGNQNSAQSVITEEIDVTKGSWEGDVKVQVNNDVVEVQVGPLPHLKIYPKEDEDFNLEYDVDLEGEGSGASGSIKVHILQNN